MKGKYLKSNLEHATAFRVPSGFLAIPAGHDKPNGVVVSDEDLAVLQETVIFKANVDSGKYQILDEVPIAEKSTRELLEEKDAKIAELEKALTESELKVQALEAENAALKG